MSEIKVGSWIIDDEIIYNDIYGTYVRYFIDELGQLRYFCGGDTEVRMRCSDGRGSLWTGEHPDDDYMESLTPVCRFDNNLPTPKKDPAANLEIGKVYRFRDDDDECWCYGELTDIRAGADFPYEKNSFSGWRQISEVPLDEIGGLSKKLSKDC